MAGKHYDLDTDILLGGESSSNIFIPSQKAVKDYVDNLHNQDKLTPGDNIIIENGVISATVIPSTKVTFRSW